MSVFVDLVNEFQTDITKLGYQILYGGLALSTLLGTSCGVALIIHKNPQGKLESDAQPFYKNIIPDLNLSPFGLYNRQPNNMTCLIKGNLKVQDEQKFISEWKESRQRIIVKPSQLSDIELVNNQNPSEKINIHLRSYHSLINTICPYELFKHNYSTILCSYLANCAIKSYFDSDVPDSKKFFGLDNVVVFGIKKILPNGKQGLQVIKIFKEAVEHLNQSELNGIKSFLKSNKIIAISSAVVAVACFVGLIFKKKSQKKEVK